MVDERTWADVVRGVPRSAPKVVSPTENELLRSTLLMAGLNREALKKFEAQRHQWQGRDIHVNRTYPVDDDVDTWVKVGEKALNWKSVVQTSRSFILPMLRKHKDGIQKLYFSRMNACLLFFSKAVVEKRSYLLRFPSLFFVALVHICLKTQNRKSENDYEQLLTLEKHFISFSDLKVIDWDVEKKDIVDAEFELMRAADWYVPMQCSYEAIKIIFGRLRFFAEDGCQTRLDLAQRVADDFLIKEINAGRDCGFYTAKIVVGRSLRATQYANWRHFESAVGDGTVDI